ncbi:89_t:CDS:2 [Scutellospora calospora]|uniref:89_t:CDS:1 n=1 Tax=Scutellospora calospora TaxID=85575 RepID=A0ACA9MMX8_9GLOM|nr:89_t:CDS:2 [Scutellospora calospora]
MTLHPKVEKDYNFKDGWFIRDHRKILEERDLWSGQKLDCNQKESNGCCARHILIMQADFLKQKTSIAESVEAAGHIFELYPKFHCECNFIERYWGAAKQTARHQCDYSYAQLQIRVPKILDNIPLSIIRRFNCKAWRYIEAYANGLEGKDAERAVKQFKSHRRIRVND